MKVQLVYFDGCPNVGKAREVLKSIGIANIEEVNQINSETAEEFKKYSSPSILVNGDLIFGERANPGGSCSFGEMDIQKLKEALQKAGHTNA